jgi:hypothetical protein
MQEVRAANQKADFHWFDPSTLRFFDSHPGRTLYSPGSFFLSSEKGPNGIRAYSIRQAQPDGSIETVGEGFQGYATRYEALTAVRRLVKVEGFRQDGSEAGRAAGSWVTDGNTSPETFRAILKGYEEGDPAVMDYAPSPLSGEWAGESMPEILGESADDDEIATAYEESYIDAFWCEVLRSCRYALGLQVAS